MKKQLALKYPHSASLFRFCRRVLDHKLSGVRIIDQDVGQLLGFDPADCSHWKKGKKNIHSIFAMRSLAKNLGVDEKLVVDLASGDIDDEEAYCEFLGYGSIELDTKTIESAKRDFFRLNSSRWTRDREQEFRDYFKIEEAHIESVVSEIHQRIKFLEAPLYLPELVGYYPDVVLEDLPELNVSAEEQVKIRQEKQKLVISYKRGSEMRPYVRYRIAKMMSQYFLPPTKGLGSELKEYAAHISDVEGNLFAGHLLAPSHLIRKEMRKIDVAKDPLTQLAEIFWVSKSFMNLRLKDILQAGS